MESGAGVGRGRGQGRNPTPQIGGGVAQPPPAPSAPVAGAAAPQPRQNIHQSRVNRQYTHRFLPQQRYQPSLPVSQPPSGVLPQFSVPGAGNFAQGGVASPGGSQFGLNPAGNFQSSGGFPQFPQHQLVQMQAGQQQKIQFQSQQQQMMQGQTQQFQNLSGQAAGSTSSSQSFNSGGPSVASAPVPPVEQVLDPRYSKMICFNCG